MARKKYKNFKIEQDELKPITIGAFESRKKTSIGIFVILTIFVVVVIFLPQISEIVNEYLNPTPDTPVIPNNPEEPNDPDTPEEPGENEDETFYAYVENLNIERDDVTVSGITVDTTASTLTYRVTNNSTTYVNLEELNYFLEIYNADRTLMERVKLVTTSGVIAGGAHQDYTKTITTDAAGSIGYLVLVQKTTDDYPEVTLPADAEGQANLVCTRPHETVTYEFMNNKLKSLTSIIEYSTEDTDYLTVYSNYQTLSNSYNTNAGVTSTFFNNITGFNITTIVNLEEASRAYIFNADSFSLDTEPKVVSFEMEAQGFTCE